ncbi:MAG: hypothetical protein JNL60_09965 [Bacteroidia bacterium]|nr:hypothetical protein [Bacteroidia bacterium]
MKFRFLGFFLFMTLHIIAQDKIYMQDGSCRVAKVLEIGLDEITVVPISESGAPFINANETISKWDIVLIEYKNGTVEYLNSPRTDIVNDGNSRRAEKQKKISDKVIYHNFASINTLALCNSDIAGFFEHLSDNSKFGIGIMGAYNFNKYAGGQNAFISQLNASKKKYDAGAFFNFYPAGFKRRSAFYFGLMIKYTAFTFSSTQELNSGGQVSYKYTPAKGSQLATMITIGNQTNLTKTVFLKTIAGFGAYTLRGEYKREFNYQVNASAQASTNPNGTKTNIEPVTYNMLPKLYFGINIGCNF